MSPFIRYPSLAAIGLTLAALISYPRADARPEAGYAVKKGQLNYEVAELNSNLRAIAANPSVSVDPAEPAPKQNVVIQAGIHDKHHQH